MDRLLRTCCPRVLRTLPQGSQNFGCFTKPLCFIDVTRVLRTLPEGSENFGPLGSQNPVPGFSEVCPGVLRSRSQNLVGASEVVGLGCRINAFVIYRFSAKLVKRISRTTARTFAANSDAMWCEYDLSFVPACVAFENLSSYYVMLSRCETKLTCMFFDAMINVNMCKNILSFGPKP